MRGTEHTEAIGLREKLQGRKVNFKNLKGRISRTKIDLAGGRRGQKWAGILFPVISFSAGEGG